MGSPVGPKATLTRQSRSSRRSSQTGNPGSKEPSPGPASGDPALQAELLQVTLRCRRLTPKDLLEGYLVIRGVEPGALCFLPRGRPVRGARAGLRARSCRQGRQSNTAATGQRLALGRSRQPLSPLTPICSRSSITSAREGGRHRRVQRSVPSPEADPGGRIPLRPDRKPFRDISPHSLRPRTARIIPRSCQITVNWR